MTTINEIKSALFINNPEKADKYRLTWHGKCELIPFIISIIISVPKTPTKLTIFLVNNYIKMMMKQSDDDAGYIGVRRLSFKDLTTLHDVSPNFVCQPEHKYIEPECRGHHDEFADFETFLKHSYVRFEKLTDHQKLLKNEKTQLQTYLKDDKCSLRIANMYWDGGMPSDQKIFDICQESDEYVKMYAYRCVRAFLQQHWLIDPAYKLSWTFDGRIYSIMYAVRDGDHSKDYSPTLSQLRAIQKIFIMFNLDYPNVIGNEFSFPDELDREKLLNHIKTTQPQREQFEGNKGDIGKIWID